MARRRIQLGQRLEREAAPVELGVGDVQPGDVHHPVSPEEDVQVEEPRSPPLGADPAMRPLDVQGEERVV